MAKELILQAHKSSVMPLGETNENISKPKNSYHLQQGWLQAKTELTFV